MITVETQGEFVAVIVFYNSHSGMITFWLIYNHTISDLFYNSHSGMITIKAVLALVIFENVLQQP